MTRFFISYRRDDTSDASTRLYKRMVERYGRENVFMDVDDIPVGLDFRRILQAEVGKCDAMLVVIGRQWVSVTDETGRRRLENPNDFVRIEVEAALARNIPVVPVLVQNAAMPAERDLPGNLAGLAFRNGLSVHPNPYFDSDVGLLLARLDRLVSATSPAPTTSTVGARPVPPVQPARPAIPRDRFPEQLAKLGYEAHANGSLEYILPPLVTVPAGEFLMGSDPKRDSGTYDWEKPQHRVTLPAFHIAKFPITVAEYACFVRSGHAAPTRWEYQGKVVDWQTQLQRLEHPVVMISWHDAEAYAAWLAQQTGQRWRLPSEAEWEKAARGTAGRIYPWGETFDKSRCNTSEGGKGTTTPVGSYASGASPYGAQDMSGNVWEWTSSLYKPYPYTPSDGREDVNSTEIRVLRGGSWLYNSRDARVAFRVNDHPGNAVVDLGARLACAVPNS